MCVLHFLLRMHERYKKKDLLELIGYEKERIWTVDQVCQSPRVSDGMY